MLCLLCVLFFSRSLLMQRVLPSSNISGSLKCPTISQHSGFVTAVYMCVTIHQTNNSKTVATGHITNRIYYFTCINNTTESVWQIVSRKLTKCQVSSGNPNCLLTGVISSVHVVVLGRNFSISSSLSCLKHCGICKI